MMTLMGDDGWEAEDDDKVVSSYYSIVEKQCFNKTFVNLFSYCGGGSNSLSEVYCLFFCSSTSGIQDFRDMSLRRSLSDSPNRELSYYSFEL